MAKKAPAWPAATIEMMKAVDLKPYAQNTKEHTPQQIEQLGKSFDEFGWTNPVLVDEKGEIIAGHGRVMMAISKGILEVPVMRAVGWTQAQKRDYRIFDNRSAELSTWNQPALQAELKQMQSAKGFELKNIGFTPLQVDAILKPPAPEKQSSRAGTGVMQFNIVFDNADQQQRWFKFVRKVKASYPSATTFAAAMDEFIKEQNVE